MPLQNRVTPEGDIIATPARGLMMGNRGGALHDAARQLKRRRWVSRQWICCRLAFNDRRRQVMAPGRYTELFFLDEATALSAGHRPCFECRRQEFLWFASLWAQVHGGDRRAAAGDIDDRLHAERLDPAGGKLTWRAPLADLPSGAFIRLDGQPRLVLGGHVLAWAPDGYRDPIERPDDRSVDVLTPRASVSVLAAGYCPSLHPSAEAPA